MRSFADERRALSFVYVVRDGDEAVHFKHAGSDTLELYENATIKRASTNPTTDALINLPDPEGGASRTAVCCLLAFMTTRIRRVCVGGGGQP